MQCLRGVRTVFRSVRAVFVWCPTVVRSVFAMFFVVIFILIFCLFLYVQLWAYYHFLFVSARTAFGLSNAAMNYQFGLKLIGDVFQIGGCPQGGWD